LKVGALVRRHPNPAAGLGHHETLIHLAGRPNLGRLIEAERYERALRCEPDRRVDDGFSPTVASTRFHPVLGDESPSLRAVFVVNGADSLELLDAMEPSVSRHKRMPSSFVTRECKPTSGARSHAS